MVFGGPHPQRGEGAVPRVAGVGTAGRSRCAKAGKERTLGFQSRLNWFRFSEEMEEKWRTPI